MQQFPRSANMSDFVQVATTTQTKEDALQVARALVERRLAACVQVDGPITSVYRWKGKIENASEWLLLAKTKATLAAQLAAHIKEAHSYDVPEIVLTPIIGGLDDYLNWIRDETADC